MRHWLVLAFVMCACGDNTGAQLVRVTAEPPGGHCATGGKAVAVGLDRNGDGTLQDAEVDSTDYVCNVSEEPTQTVVDTKVEAPGVNCTAGGIAIRTGRDGDGDGVLDDGEVLNITYICNADNGDRALVEMRPEPPGQNCYLGGVTIVVGTDLDGDGVLAAAEITGTSFLCSVSAGGTLEGSYQIANTLDLALLAGVHTITGPLGTFGQLPEIDLPELESVGAIFLNSRVTDVPVLRTIAGNASFDQCHRLTAPMLESVGGWLSVSAGGSSPPLDALDLPALRTIGADLFTATTLVHVRLPALVSAGNIQQFWTEVTDLDLSSLQHVGNLGLDPRLLPAVSLPKLIDAANLFLLVDAATSIDLPVLAGVGRLTIDAEVLTALQMPAVTSIGGPVTISTPQLSGCVIDDILAQASYSGPRTIQAAPCP